MSTFHLGTSTVQRVGFGAMQLPGPGVFGPPRDHDAAIAVLRRAVELGVNHIDTAQYYGPDVVQRADPRGAAPLPRRPRAGLQGRRRPRRPGRLAPGPEAGRPAGRRRGQPPLARRRAARRGQPAPDARRPRCPRHAAGPARRPARRDGGAARRGQDRRHRRLHGAARRGRARPSSCAGITCVQNAYSLLDRSDEAVLDRCLDAGVAYVPYFPLGSAFPADAQGHRDDGCAASPSVSARPRPRSGWPGCSRTGTTSC